VTPSISHVAALTCLSLFGSVAGMAGCAHTPYEHAFTQLCTLL